MSEEKSTQEQLSQLRELVNHLTDELTIEQNRKRNVVPGGFYLMNRSAEKNLRILQQENPRAALMFSVLREHMQIGSNAVTVSNEALSKILNCHKRTIVRSSKYLRENSYVQVIKTGTTNTYVINEQIAFAGTPGQRKAVFSASVVAHECEQDKGWDQVKKLKPVPVIYSDERPVLDNEKLPPPDQTDLDLN